MNCRKGWPLWSASRAVKHAAPALPVSVTGKTSKRRVPLSRQTGLQVSVEQARKNRPQDKIKLRKLKLDMKT